MKAEIRSSQSPHDMSWWLTEKAQHVLQFMVYLYEDFRERDDLPEQFIEDFMFYLYPILSDSTKILSFSSGAEWSTEDRALILDEGRPGLEKVLVRYGLLHETTEEKTKHELPSSINGFVSGLEELLAGTKDPSRTLINELLSTTRINEPILDKIEKLTENINMGELPWEEYVDSANLLLEELKKKYPQEEG